MRIILSFLGITLLLLSACKQPAKKTTNNLDELVKEAKKASPGINAGADNFSIKSADGWTQKDTSFSGLKCLFVTSPLENEQDSFRDNLNVVTERCGTMGLEEYYKVMAENLKTLTGFEEKKLSDKTINGMEFKDLKYSHKYGGTPIDVDLYVTVKDGIAYLITCSVLKGDMARWESAFQSMVESFTIN